jgi:transcriptional regulator with XRE-family HTH domain/tetratricopeptide (TPR) repeat protein
MMNKHSAVLRHERELRGWSQQDLADHLGSNRVTVSRWEQGNTIPDRYFQARLCQLFKKSREELGFVAPAETDDVAPPPGVFLDPMIPISSPYFVGREVELEELKRRLQSPEAWVALHGLPGVGKTTLVAALTHDEAIRQQFQGILWATLGPEAQAEQHLTRWGALLGIAWPDDIRASPAQALSLRTILGDQRWLIILDDCWSLEDVMPFKVGGEQCTYILTTRYPLLAAQTTSETVDIPELSEQRGLELLYALAPKLEQNEAERLTHLAHAVGGLPLALTLIGNYLRAQSYSGLQHRIQAAFDRLNDIQVRLTLSEPRSPLEKQSFHPQVERLSLNAIIAISDQYLSPQMREVFYALSIFPAKPYGFPEEAGLAVAQCSLEDLYALVDAGLVEVSDNRYFLHQLIADYARLHLEATNAYVPVQERLMSYVRTLADEPNYLEKTSIFSMLISTALEIAYQRDKLLFLHILAKLQSFLRFQMKKTTALLWLSRGLEVPVSTPDDELAHARIGRALAILDLDAQKKPRSKQLLEEGLATASKFKNHLLAGEVLYALAFLESQERQYSQAENHLQEGYAEALLSQSQTLQSAILIDMIQLHMMQGNLVEARKTVESVLALVDSPESQLEHSRLASSAYDYQGMLAFFLDQDYGASEQYYLKALALSQQLHISSLQCSNLNGLGIARAAQGKFQEAEKTFHEALALAQQFEEHDGLCIALLNLTALSHEQGDHSTMMSYLKEAVKAAKQFGLLQYIQQSHELYKASASPDQQQEDFSALFQQAIDESSP